MTVPQFETLPQNTEATIEREQGSGKPLILQPDGSVLPYDRASSYGKAIDNGAGLLYWAKCMVVKGAAMSPSIVKAAKPLDYYDGGKEGLIELAEKAMTLAGASDKATEGTAMHSYTELIDRGLDLPPGLDDETLRDLAAYRKVTEGLTYPDVEQFVVCDEVRAAGTFDRTVVVPDCEPWPPWLRGKTVIGDLKTGNTDYVASILVQLAIYARGKKYNPVTGERTLLGVEPNIGLILGLPLGKGTAEIVAVDLSLGWAGVLAAQAARAFQGAAKLGCKACNEGSGFYKNGNPCRSCKGTPRVAAGVTVRTA